MHVCDLMYGRQHAGMVDNFLRHMTYLLLLWWWVCMAVLSDPVPPHIHLLFPLNTCSSYSPPTHIDFLRNASSNVQLVLTLTL